MSDSEFSAESISVVDDDDFGEMELAINEEPLSGKKRSIGESSSCADPIVIPESADSGSGF